MIKQLRRPLVVVAAFFVLAGAGWAAQGALTTQRHVAATSDAIYACVHENGDLKVVDPGQARRARRASRDRRGFRDRRARPARA
jgi:hypothetical protein